MSKVKILIGPSSFGAIDKTPIERLMSAGYEIIDNPFKRKLKKGELLDLLGSEIIGLIAGLEPLSRDVLERSQLQVISRVGSGLSNVDLDAAKELDIKVCYTPDGPTSAVAELTVSTMLSLLRMVPKMDRSLHEGKWEKRVGGQLNGKVVAIIGFGRIGRYVADLLKPFKIRILVVDPYLNDNSVEFSVLPLEDALPKADIITIHSSGDDCLLGENEFSLLKDGAYLLNPARGGLISEKALIRALENGKVRGAWLDTFENEPYEGPLADFDQVILTPHVGSYTEECRRQMENEAVTNLIDSFKQISKCD